MLARAVTSLRLRALDALIRDPLVPPHRLRGFVGDSEFVSTGEEFLTHFVELGGLRAGDDVLDVGCGIGRMARPLTRLGVGSYTGFDVNAQAIAWCQERYPAGFRFVHADIANGMYNPDGSLTARDYAFPVDDASIDFVLATSVFTHLLKEDAAHYLDEVRRVLRPGGRVLLTFYTGVYDPDEQLVRFPPEWIERHLPGARIHRDVSTQDIVTL